MLKALVLLTLAVLFLDDVVKGKNDLTEPKVGTNITQEQLSQKIHAQKATSSKHSPQPRGTEGNQPSKIVKVPLHFEKKPHSPNHTNLTHHPALLKNTHHTNRSKSKLPPQLVMQDKQSLLTRLGRRSEMEKLVTETNLSPEAKQRSNKMLLKNSTTDKDNNKTFSVRSNSGVRPNDFIDLAMDEIYGALSKNKKGNQL